MKTKHSPQEDKKHSAEENPQTLATERAWLTEKIAQRIQMAEEEIDPNMPFASLGLDSAGAVSLSSELEKHLGREVAPTVIYDYPSIDSLVQHFFNDDDGNPTGIRSGNAARAVSESEAPSGVVAVHGEDGLVMDDRETYQAEAIAIIGYGCRLPGADTPQAFWQLLRDGVDAITEVPASRWDVNALYDADAATPGKMSTRWGGFLDQVDQFDPHFFGISPREARSMDPQQRLLLEVAWEALENSGIAPVGLAGSNTGVFMGVWNHDYGRLQSGRLEAMDAYAGTGTAYSIAANRLSYILDLHGPSFAVDTACSSSLVAIHEACQSLRLSECDLTLAGGVNLLLAPDVSIIFSQARMLSPDGRCKTFDATANGYVRSEGCGVVVLKRHADAVRDGDRVLALIRGSAVNQDGRSNGLTAPSSIAQQEVIRRALAQAGVSPADIGYVEAHGTGTPLGDPIEVNALKAVFLPGRSEDQPCWIGSVKTNIGHLEAAAGAAGLLKIVEAMGHGQIPPHLHFKEPNPHLDLQDTPLAIPVALTAWPSPAGQPRRAGVSSFGFGGTNAHVVLEEAPPTVLATSPRERPRHVLALSAKSPDALTALAGACADRVRGLSAGELADFCYSINSGRQAFQQRLALVAGGPAELAAQLDACRRGEEAAGSVRGECPGNEAPSIAFLFTGQGAQYPDMGRELYENEPHFRAALDRCDAILREHLESPLLSVLYGPDQESINDTAYAQPALFALEYALATTWQAWGITPDAVMGHSVGEYVAACIAGVFSLEDGLALIAERGALMQALPAGGEMWAVSASADQVRGVLVGAEGAVSIAAINGPESVVISGAGEVVAAVVDKLAVAGAKSSRLTVSHAFHSPLMGPMLAAFAEAASRISYAPPKIPFISNLTGGEAKEEIARAEYWVEHVLAPVQFAAGVQALACQGIGLLVEVGPTPVLLGLAGQNGVPGRRLPSLRKGQSDWQQILSTLAELYVAGAPVDWKSFDDGHGRRRVAVPTYPFQRQSYWKDFSAYPRLDPAAGSGNSGHPLLGQALALAGTSEKRFASRLAATAPAYLGDHQVFGRAVLPATAYLEMAAAAVAPDPGTALRLEQVELRRAMFLDEGEALAVQTILSPDDDGSFGFEVYSRKAEGPEASWLLHAEGRLARGDAKDARAAPATVRAAAMAPMAASECYRQLAKQGLAYGPAFQAIDGYWRDGLGGALARLRLPPALATEQAGYRFHPVLLDACLQAAVAALDPDNLPADSVPLPVSIATLECYRTPGASLWCRAALRAREREGTQEYLADLTLFDEDGSIVAELSGLRLKLVPRSLLADTTAAEDIYCLEWRALPRTDAGTDAGDPVSWLLFLDQTGFGRRLGALLEAAGQSCTYVSAGTAYRQMEPHHLEIDPEAPADYRHLLQALSVGDATALRVVDLRALDCPAIREDQTTALAGSHLHQACAGALALLQALAEAFALPPAVTLVTRGGVAVVNNDPSAGLAQTALQGLAKSVAAEMPGWPLAVIDLDPAGLQEQGATELLTELRGPAGREFVAWRQGQRHVARLVHGKLASFADKASFRKDGTYLITGGLGDLGLRVAQWAGERGAGHLVLMSRHEPGREAAERVEKLRQAGIGVEIALADVSQPSALAAMVERIRASLPPLRGVIHAAGLVDDGSLAHQSRAAFARVLAPKVLGAWHLHALTAAMPLDFFVLFSSMASLLGTAGQSNYAAANAILDALAHYRRARGLPALSINWGPWSETGMAHRLGVVAGLAEVGLGAVSPTLGLQRLGQLMSQDSLAQAGVVPIDWPKFLARRGAPEVPPLFADMAAEQGADQAAAPAGKLRQDLIDQVQSLPSEQSQSLLVDYLGAVAGRVLKLDADQTRALAAAAGVRRLSELGFDSLMAIEMRGRINGELGVDVPIHVFIGGSTLAQIGELIGNQLMLNRLLAAAGEAEDLDEEMEVFTL